MKHFNLKTSADTSYFGGKSGAGTYQTIINQIPPHDVFVSGCLGKCGIMRHKRPADHNIGFELNRSVIADWCDDTRLKIHNESFLDSAYILSQLKGKIYIYIDPPYLMETRLSKKDRYKFEMTREQHIKLLQYLLKLRGDINIAISTYPNSLYLEYLKNWRCISFQSNTRHGMRTEHLYMNYAEPKELHDYSYLGDDYRQREQIKKKQKSLVQKIEGLPPKERMKLYDTINVFPYHKK